MKIKDRDQYIQAVKTHPFQYEKDGDLNKWKKGVSSYAAIMYAQPVFDPAFAIWNAHAPKDMKRKV